MVNVLAFDTTSKLLSIALETGKGLFEHFIAEGFKHSENLALEIKYITQTARINMEDIDLIVCPEGPGSFTGLRIGLSTAKGISFALNKPYVTVPTLDMMSYGKNYFEGIILPVIDARKKRFYTALYKKGERISDFLDISYDSLSSLLSEHSNVLITGADADIFNKVSKEKYLLDPDFKKGYARYLLPLGRERFKQAGPAPDGQGPLYLRKSEAEIGITR